MPERTAAGQGVPPTHGRGLRNWLDSLPLANASSAAQTLSAAMDAANRSDFPAERRLNLLESLRPGVTQVCETLEKRFLGQSIPLLRAPREAYQQVHGLLDGLVIGYRIAMFDLSAKGTPRFARKKRLALACARSMSCLAERLLRADQIYAAEPADLWRGLYATWHLARSHGLDEQTIEDENCRYRQQRTLNDILIQALLLAVCNPHRLGQREIAEVSAAMEVWCEDCELKKLAVPGQGIFTFDIAEDRGPRVLASDDDAGSASRWILDAGALARRLQSKSVQQQAQRVALEQSSRERILMAWGVVAPRGFRRLPARHRLEAVVGLHGVHYAIAGMRDFESLARGETDTRGQLAHWARASNDQRAKAPTVCQVVDQSFGGYRLKWRHDQNVRLKVGELLATARPADVGQEQNWILGVVRWIRSDSENNLEAGVELLARTSEAVILFPNPERRNPGNAIRGLLLEPLSRSEPEMPMLICDPSLNQAERMVMADRRCNTQLLPREDSLMRLKLVRCIEHTPAFSQFHYQVRNQQSTRAGAS